MKPKLLAFLLCLAGAPALAQDAREGDQRLTVDPRTPAEVRQDTLDSLFARLRLAGRAEEKTIVEQAIWKLWMSTDSPTANLLLRQAALAMSAAEHKAALEQLDALVNVHPDFTEAWNKRATLHFMVGRFDASLADIEKVLDLEPRHFGALAGLGMIRQRQGKLSDALKAFRAALAINPNMPGVSQAVKEIEDRETPI